MVDFNRAAEEYPELFNLNMSDEAKPLYNAVKDFV